MQPKHEHDNKKYKTCGIQYKDCGGCLDYSNIKDVLILYRWLCCNRNYQKKFDENLKIWVHFLTMY